VFRVRPLLTTPAGAYVVLGLVLTSTYLAVGHGSLAQSVIYDSLAAAAGIAVLVVGSAPPEAQLVALSFLAGLLGAAIASSALRRTR
jgi:hypothetical protein